MKRRRQERERSTKSTRNDGNRAHSRNGENGKRKGKSAFFRSPTCINTLSRDWLCFVGYVCLARFSQLLR